GQQLDGRTDQYSLGCVLFECLAGEVPFGRDSEMALLWAHVYQPPPSLTAIRPELSQGLDAVIRRAMAKAPDDRYPNCRSFVNAARQELGLAPVEETLPAGDRVPVGSAAVEGGAAVGIPGPVTPVTPVPSPAAVAPVAAPGPPASVRRSRRRLLAAGVTVVVIAAAVVAGVVLTSGKGGTKHPTKSPSAIHLVVNSAARIDPSSNRLVGDVPAGDGAAGIVTGAGSVWIASTGNDN